MIRLFPVSVRIASPDAELTASIGDADSDGQADVTAEVRLGTLPPLRLGPINLPARKTAEAVWEAGNALIGRLLGNSK